MGPTDLAPIHRPEVERLRSIADEDSAKRAVERLERRLAVVGEDLEHRRRLRRDGPERAGRAGLQPARAVGVLDRAGADAPPRLLHRGRAPVADARPDRAPRAAR